MYPLYQYANKRGDIQCHLRNSPQVPIKRYCAKPCKNIRDHVIKDDIITAHSVDSESIRCGHKAKPIFLYKDDKDCLEADCGYCNNTLLQIIDFDEEEEEGKLQEKVSNALNLKGISSKFFNIAKEYAKVRTKQYFGTELMLNNESNYSGSFAKSRAVGVFLKKYDPNFDNHFAFEEEGDYSTYRLVGGFALIPVKNPKLNIYDTFIYVASGIGLYGSDSRKAFQLGFRASESDLYFYICGKRSNILMKELKSILIKSDKPSERENIEVYEVLPQEDTISRDPLYILNFRVKKRKISSLYYSNGEIEKIVNHIDRFLSQESFYNERELLFKTGILLYGNPGTGKSTVAKVIASHYDRDVLSVNIPKLDKLNLTALSEAINSDYHRYIVLLEDIDTLFLDRENSSSSREDNAVINKLLQFLDSNTSPNNVIFIATTNHISKLDSALLRDGRFDIKIEMKGLTEKDAIRMTRDFGVDDKNIQNVIEDYRNSKPDDILFNQSKLQNILLDYIGFKAEE